MDTDGLLLQHFVFVPPCLSIKMINKKNSTWRLKFGKVLIFQEYELPTPFGFQDIAWTRFHRSRSLRQGQRSNQGHIIILHTYNPQLMSLPSINFLHFMLSEIWAGQDFIGQGQYGKVNGQIEVTP